MKSLPGFPAFVADQSQPLAGTAFLLTGDADVARALVFRSLGTVAARWASLRWSHPAHAARTALFAAYLRGDRRRAARTGPRAAPSHTPVGSLASALAALPARHRALIVACFYQGVAEWQAAELCRTDPRSVRTETVLAVSEVRWRLSASSPGGTAATPDPSGSAPRSRDRPAGQAGEPDGGGRPAPPAAAGPGQPDPWAPPSPEPAAAPPSTPPWPAAPRAWQQPPPGGPGEPGSDGGVAEDPWYDELRHGLNALAGEMPALDAGEAAVAEILRSAGRRRARRRALTATVGLALAAFLITPVAVGISALGDAILRTAAPSAGPSGHQHGPAGVPDPLPAAIADPISFAYQSYCPSALVDGLEGEESGCEQWRVVTTKGDQWRIADVKLDSFTGRTLFAVSADGNRIAYVSDSLGDVVVRDRHAPNPEEGELIDGVDSATDHAGLVISPTGRWVGVDFGTVADAPRPRLRDLTTRQTWTLPERLTILAISDAGAVTGTVTDDVTKVPGYISTTRLVQLRPDGRPLNQVPVDPALFDNGAALAPDGHALAVSAEPAHPSDDEHGLLVTIDPATGKVLTRSEASLPPGTHLLGVRGWAGDHEVLADTERSSDDEDDYPVYAIDVRSGSAREIVLDTANGTPGTWVPGTLH